MGRWRQIRLIAQAILIWAQNNGGAQPAQLRIGAIHKVVNRIVIAFYHEDARVGGRRWLQ
jgi:hypothetical protein